MSGDFRALKTSRVLLSRLAIGDTVMFVPDLPAHAVIVPTPQKVTQIDADGYGQTKRLDNGQTTFTDFKTTGWWHCCYE